MSTQATQLTTTVESFPQGTMDELLEERESLLRVLLLRGMLEQRINGYERMVGNESTLTDIRPRSDQDVSSFEHFWTDSGRDAYRFAAF